MQANKERVGAFTSSNIYRLMTNGSGEGGVGAPFRSYVEEKRLSKLNLVVGENTENVNHYQFSEMQRMYPILGIEIIELV